MSIPRYVVGTTKKVTWTSSGQSPSAISAAVYTGSESIVSSGPMTDSGNGHYWRMVSVPSSPGFYVFETRAIIGGNPFLDRLPFRATAMEVD